MADDGMLVNFSLSNEIIRSKPVFRGGRWRDRLSAKRSTRPRPAKPTASDSNSIPVSAQDPAVATKDEDHPEKHIDELRKRRKLDPQSRASTTANGAPKEVISSLFTYNPSAKATAEKAQENDEHPAEPSNAPLPDGIETFTSLGLSTTLSAHILTKLSLQNPTAIQASTVKQLLMDDADAFIQAETGSGKTLAYLLPIVQRTMNIPRRPAEDEIKHSNESNGNSPKNKLNRKAGLFAIILAPTRELAAQISQVLSLLLTRAPYIVASTVVGGEKRKSEKARLRKGLNILVATPGRLVDHLEHTEVLDVSQVRWLVLDEGDRLMELGFEEEIKTIVERLEKAKGFETGKREQAEEAGRPALPHRRITILCSATMKMTTLRLGEISLKDAIHIKADLKPLSDISGNTNDRLNTEVNMAEKEFQAPAQLQQSYIIVPPKQRLVTLFALLKHTFARRGSVMKAIVFLSSGDSVDFHFEVFARKIDEEATGENSKPAAPSVGVTVSSAPTLTSKSNPSVNVYRYYGDLHQSIRKSTLRAFSTSTDPAILLCTDLGSRGLDVPNVDLVIEFDPASTADVHLHRVGRTARAGRAGRAECFLMPGAEEGYVEVLKQGVASGKVSRHEAENILKKGFLIEKDAEPVRPAKSEVQGPRNWEEAATEYQLEVERWVINDNHAREVAERGWKGHVKAYTTHVAKERNIFDKNSFHLGHIAKAFALREPPIRIGRGSGAIVGRRPQKREKRKAGVVATGTDTAILAAKNANSNWRKADVDAEPVDGRDAAKKMRSKMKEHMAVASEFNIG